jgi:putative addiction module component (TIGR02574 family)
VGFFVNLWTDEDGVWIAECLARPGDGMDPDRQNWPLTPEMRALLDVRIADHERNPGGGEPWEAVMERIRIDLRNRE